MCDKVCEVAKEVCKQSTAHLVASCEHEPCLQSCACDGTPIQVSVSMQEHLPTGRLIKRGGKAAHEFLVASEFTRYVSTAGETKTSLVVRDALPLTEGKATARLVEACTSQWLTLRQRGHLGPIVQHYCWDRFGWQAMRRRMLQLHNLLKDQWGGGEDGPSSSLLWLLQWNAFNACAVHDAQNAFRWSMREMFDDGDLPKSVYIGVASIRNSTDAILTYIGEWVSTSMQYADPLDPAEKQLWRTVWVTLGLKDDLVQLLADGLELRWIGGEHSSLAVARTATDGNTISVVCSILLAVWNIPKYSDSRWLTVGIAAKSMVASQLTGITAFLQFLSKKPSTSSYYLGGFLRMEVRGWQSLLHAAVVGAVPQAAQLALLKDSRVATTAPAIKASMAKEVERLAALPGPVWETLAAVGDYSMGEFRATCLAAAHKACTFV